MAHIDYRKDIKADMHRQLDREKVKQFGQRTIALVTALSNEPEMPAAAQVQFHMALQNLQRGMKAAGVN